MGSVAGAGQGVPNTLLEMGSSSWESHWVPWQLVLSTGFLFLDERDVEISSFTLMIIATSQRSS